MKDSDVKTGMRVRVTTLNSTQGMLIHSKHLAIRQLGKEGTVEGYVPGHGGDVWWVRQDNGVAAYAFREIEEVV
jgi:hypothetical protein